MNPKQWRRELAKAERALRVDDFWTARRHLLRAWECDPRLVRRREKYMLLQGRRN